MIFAFIFLLLAIFLIIKSADYAISYSSKIAEGLGLSKYVVGFLIISIISILPETLVSVTSAFEGVPSFGLGTLFGSNVADLTLVFALVLFVSHRNLKVESKIIKNAPLHIGVMIVPIMLGLNGYYSRIEGIILILLGTLFYLYVLKKHEYESNVVREKFSYKNLLLLIVSMGGLLIGAHFTVKYGVNLASILNISPVIIGMFVVGLGTTLPELFFSIKAAKSKHDGLALGDILGTVVADATIVVGIVAVISPFSFNGRIVYITGVFMVLAIILLFYFMKTGKVLTRKEGFLLLLFYTAFVLTELLTSDLIKQ